MLAGGFAHAEYAAVAASLFGVVTILLAWRFLGERLGRVQGAGLALVFAGIATLAPIPEVPPGDVDLIAPLGTIDAGEAGIRVSGNVNIAALQVVNAANIQVQGESKGIPVTAVVNTGALSNASAAATSAASAAQDAVARTRAAAQQALPSIISVQVLGFGNEPVPKPVPSGNERVSYDSSSTVRVVAEGQPSDAAKGQLTARERANLMP